MASTKSPATATVNSVALSSQTLGSSVPLPDYDKQRIEDIGFLTDMTLVLLGNYAQTGHFGGPLAYSAYTVASHLAGPDLGGLRFDYRRPKHPYADKFMLAGGHNAPVTYALWMIMGEAMARKHAQSGDARFHVDPNLAMLSIDALGFRRGAGALKNLLEQNNLQDHPIMAQAKIRGIRSLAGHAETTDVTNDVNGGPSGIGIATAAGKAAFWDIMGAPDSLKILAIEGEFAMTSGHAQELKTTAVAQQVGKRLRILLSYNNAGIDDELVGGVINPAYAAYRIQDQWASYGWNVFALDDGNDYDQVVAVLKTMEDWDPTDNRPMIVVGRTVKGWWPAAENGNIPGFGEQIVSYHSHPYAFAMNGDYFQALAATFEQRFGVEFQGIRDGAVSDNRERLIQFKHNIDVAMSVLEKDGLGDWLAERLVEIGDSVNDELPLRVDRDIDPFLDPRLGVGNLPIEPQKVTIRNPVSGAEKEATITLFEEPGRVRGTRRGISEIIKWMNYVTGNRLITVAADLSDSINVESGSFWGHYDPVDNPAGTRLKAYINGTQEIAARVRAGLTTGLGEVVDSTGPWIILGLALAAVMHPLLDSNWTDVFPNGVGEIEFFAILGIPVYVCASGATPLVAVLVYKGISPGAALAFLLTGPATNITTFGVLSKLHGRTVALAFGAVIAAMAVLLGHVVDAAVPTMSTSALETSAHWDGFGLSEICLSALALLFALSLVRRGPREFVGEVFNLAGGESDGDHDHDYDDADDECCGCA